MVKDEDVCLHCGLCAERCPTGAWDMQKFLLMTTKAGAACQDAPAREGVCVVSRGGNTAVSAHWAPFIAESPGWFAVV
ncbi:MAG: 4Fe-4S binding protein [Inhella sp.]